MWNLKNGNLVLTKAEWKLFSIGVVSILESIEGDLWERSDRTFTGVEAFDVLTPEQKIVLLTEITSALVDPVTPPPKQTAANEGAIAAILSAVWFELESEVDPLKLEGDGEKSVNIRRLLLAVCKGLKVREGRLPSENYNEFDEWCSLLNKFEGYTFGDMSYGLGDEFLDLPPKQAHAKLQRLGIDSDYFLAVPDEPDKRRLTAARQTLARLLGLPVVNDDGHYPAFIDLYHDLVVGPYAPEEIVEWNANPWVQIIGMIAPEWDCDYAEWKTLFSKAVPATAFQVSAATIGIVPEFPNSMSVERFGDNWFVRNKEGNYWSALIENCWTKSPDDEGDPALAFPTEAEARAVYAQADQMYRECQKRHEEAIARLKPDNE